jgi:hypothetical protein
LAFQLHYCRAQGKARTKFETEDKDYGKETSEGIEGQQESPEGQQQSE